MRKQLKVANKVVKEGEEAAKKGPVRNVYDATRKLCSNRSKNIGAVKSKDGKLLTNDKFVIDGRKTSLNY